VWFARWRSRARALLFSSMHFIANPFLANSRPACIKMYACTMRSSRKLDGRVDVIVLHVPLFSTQHNYIF
jgi:hypothetical protein